MVKKIKEIENLLKIANMSDTKKGTIVYLENNLIKCQHVIPHYKGGWGIKKDGSLKSTKLFSLKEDAIIYAKKIAKNQNVTLVIHNKNGTVLEKITYNNDLSFLGKKI